MASNDERRRLEERRFGRVVGTPLLAFLCAASEDQIEDRLTIGRPLRRRQENVLAEVLGTAAQSAYVSFYLGSPEASSLGSLFLYDGDEKMSRANVLRRAAGGEVPPTPRGASGPEAPLAGLARDAYPVLLAGRRVNLPRPRIGPDSFLSDLVPVIFHHPQHAAFEARVQADSVLAQMFPRDTPNQGRTGFFWTSLGTGRGTQLSMLASDLLSSAAVRTRLDDTDTQAEFVAAAIEELKVLRRLLSGERVRVRCALGFIGAEIIGGPGVETPWGTLRMPSRGELELRADTPVAHSQELVLATDVPLEISLEGADQPLGEPLPPNPFSDETQATFADLQLKADRIALTLLLGLDREPPVALARTWTLLENPLVQMPSLMWAQNPVPLHAHLLNTPDRRRIVSWSQRIERHYSDRVEIAVKRTLSSLTIRSDPADRLIDAVIALENLFGTGGGELVFRISAGCAWLLERDPARRHDVQTQVSRLYDRRSKIVHGAHAPAPGDVAPDAEAAAQFCVRSLRTLFLRRQELLDVGDRSRRLILQTRAPR